MQSDYKTILEEIEEIANVGYYEVDLLTGSWTCSENIINILGLAQKESHKIEELRNLIHPDDRENAALHFNQCLESGDRFDYEYRCIIPPGKTIYIVTKSKIIRDENNIPVKLIGIKQDISTLKLKESKLKELIEINKKKNEVLSTVAHDLKSPLSSIYGMSELLQDNATADQKDLITYIQEALQTADDIITGLIEISQFEEQSELLHFRANDINEILANSIKHFKIRAEKKLIKLESKLCDNASAEVDPVKFSRIIDNLILNAIKFTNEGGLIIISSYNVPGGINICIEDNGIGIDPKIMPELFNKFSKARRKGTYGEKSTGLGLSIVKELVELHKGKISVESSVNSGTKFSIYLPSRQN